MGGTGRWQWRASLEGTWWRALGGAWQSARDGIQKLDRLVRPPWQRFFPVRYRPFVRARLIGALGVAAGREVRHTRPWHQKPHLKEIIEQYEHARGFNDAPFVLDRSNPQVYFIEKIMDAVAAEGGRVLFFLTPINQVLMEARVTKPGYRENLRRLDEFFAVRHASYLNLQSAVSQELFADYVHLTPEGYRVLAGILWEALRDGLREDVVRGVPPPSNGTSPLQGSAGR